MKIDVHKCFFDVVEEKKKSDLSSRRFFFHRDDNRKENLFVLRLYLIVVIIMLTNHHNADTFGNLMQGKVFFDENSSCPKLIWNQMKIVVLANQNGNANVKKKSSLVSSFTFIDLQNLMLNVIF